MKRILLLGLAIALGGCPLTPRPDPVECAGGSGDEALLPDGAVARCLPDPTALQPIVGIDLTRHAADAGLRR